MQRLLSRSVIRVPKRFFASTYTVKFTDASGKTKDFPMEVVEGETLFNACRAAGVPIKSVCGGNCVCGQCAVKFPDALHDQTPQSTKEKGLLTRKGKGKGMHLACQTYVYDYFDGMTIEVNYCRS